MQRFQVATVRAGEDIYVDVYVFAYVRGVEEKGDNRRHGTEDNISKGRVTTHIHGRSNSQGVGQAHLSLPLPRRVLLSQITICTLDTRLHILITHNQTTLLIPRHKHHPLIRSRV